MAALIERARTCSRATSIIKRADGVEAISGYAAVFYDGTPATEYKLWDDMVERIAPGAFDAALADDVRALFNHNVDAVLGRSKAGTLRLSTDDVGLAYEIDPPDTSIGRDVLVSLRRGDVSGSSFSFLTTGEEFAKENGIWVRTITAVSPLYDVGPVTFPAYTGTSAQANAAELTAEHRQALQRDAAGRIAGWRYFGPAGRARRMRLVEIAERT